MPFENFKQVADDDANESYDPDEVAAMRNIEYDKIQGELCDFHDVIDKNLKEDITAKNKDYLMRSSMERFFNSKIYNLEGVTEEVNLEDVAGRMKLVKLMLQKVLSKHPDYFPENISLGVNLDSDALSVEEIMAIHGFQARRRMTGKSNADAIVGPLTMQDLIHASGILKKDVEDKPFVDNSIFASWNEEKFGNAEVDKKITLQSDDVDGFDMKKLKDKLENFGNQFSDDAEVIIGNDNSSCMIQKKDGSWMVVDVSPEAEGDGNDSPPEEGLEGKEEEDRILEGADKKKPEDKKEVTNAPVSEAVKEAGEYYRNNSELLNEFLKENISTISIADFAKEYKNDNYVKEYFQDPTRVDKGARRFLTNSHAEELMGLPKVDETDGKFSVVANGGEIDVYLDTVGITTQSVYVGNLRLEDILSISEDGPKIDKSKFFEKVADTMREKVKRYIAKRVELEIKREKITSLNDLYGKKSEKADDYRYAAFWKKHIYNNGMGGYGLRVDGSDTEVVFEDGEAKVSYALDCRGNQDYLRGHKVSMSEVTTNNEFDEKKWKKEMRKTVDKIVDEEFTYRNEGEGQA